MPLLKELKLNNSSLGSVRDLGSKLKNLQVFIYVAVFVEAPGLIRLNATEAAFLTVLLPFLIECNCVHTS